MVKFVHIRVNSWLINGSLSAQFGYVLDNFGNVSTQFGHTKNDEIATFIPKTNKTGYNKKMNDNKHPFQHCPRCGQNGFNVNKPNSRRCVACGFEYFFNAAAAVAALIVNESGHLLTAVRANDPGKGMLDLPGGFVDAGESAEDAIRREIKEELNLDIDRTEYFLSTPNEYHYKDVTYATLDLAFICHVNNFNPLRPQDDVQDVLFIALEDIKIERFAFESIRRIVSAFIEKQK